MRFSHCFFGIFLMAAGAALHAEGPFSVTFEEGKIQILHRGEVLVRSVTATGLDSLQKPVRQSHATLPDGTQVWNLWREDRANRIRQEVALAPDGSRVEISMIGETDAYPQQTVRQLYLAIPLPALDNMNYQGLNGNGRSYIVKEGTISRRQTPQGDLNGQLWRYLAFTDGEERNLVFDLNPLGPGDSIFRNGAIKGAWNVVRKGKELRFIGGSVLSPSGGMTGAKAVIREGRMQEDYPAHHAQQSFNGTRKLQPKYAFSFGALRHGENFTAADDAPFDRKLCRGWISEGPLTRHNDAPEGIYYSSMAGRDGTFRISDLVPGIYLVTVTAGNFGGHPNHFSVTVNDTGVLKPTSIPPGKMGAVSRPVRVGAPGILDIQLKGDFLLSGVATQFLLAEAEDFSFYRGFWVSDGYEPAILFRNQDYRDAPALTAAVDFITMPVPGEEESAPPCDPELPVAQPNRGAPELSWLNRADFQYLGNNTATLEEYRNPVQLERFLAQAKQNGANVLLVSGMHSRHTYRRHLKRGRECLRRICTAAHRQGFKVIDHHDATLLWNLHSGFRVMAERLPETVRGFVDMTPNPQFCIMNPVFTRTYRNYLLDLMRAGVDGFQVDELSFYEHGCGCSFCRDAFFRETGCQLPLNELDPCLNNRSSTLWKRFLEWRKTKVGDWWVEFRREAGSINPNLTLCMRTTQYDFTDRRAPLTLGADPLQQARAINFFGTEITSRNCLLSSRSLLPCLKMANLLTIAYNTPIWGRVLGENHASAYFGWAACNMNGQNGMTDRRFRPGETNYRKFETSPDNMPRYGITSAAQVALLFSAPSRDWSSPMEMLGELFGLAQTLEAMHVPYDFIGEMSLNTLKRYQVLALGAANCLSDRHLAAIKEFAHNGGTVLMTGAAGSQDELGNMRETWGFADVMGCTLQCPSRAEIVKLGSAPDPAKAFACKSSLLRFHPVDASGQELRKGSAAPGAIQLYGFNRSGRAFPLILDRSCGKGRFILQCAPVATLLQAPEAKVGTPWDFELNEEVDLLYRLFLTKVLGKAGFWSVNAPDKVFTAVYRTQDGMAVHFLNARGASLKKGEIVSASVPQAPYPALREAITFTLPANRKISQVYAVSPDFPGRKPLSFQMKSNGKVSAVLPPELLKVYTIVWLR